MITSTGNASIKRIRALRHRKERERTGTFYVEGIRLVAEALNVGVELDAAVVAPDLIKGDYGRHTVERLRESVALYLEVTAPVFESLSQKEGPQGIAAVARQRWLGPAEIEPSGGLPWVALEAVADPGNLGTILRTSDAVGAPGVILLGPSTDPHDLAAVRASMGAIFSQRLVRASPTELSAWKDRHRAFVVGTSDAGDRDYTEIRRPLPAVLLMGSEREGLGDEALALCDLVARIPMVGRSDSLNLAVATGVMLYHMFEQTRSPAG